jgi:hypothetical protein
MRQSSDPGRLPFRPPLSASAVLFVALVWPSVAMLGVGTTPSGLLGELLLIASALAASRSRRRWVAASCAFAGEAVGFLVLWYVDRSAPAWAAAWPSQAALALTSSSWAAILAALVFPHIRAGTFEGADRAVMCAAPWMILPTLPAIPAALVFLYLMPIMPAPAREAMHALLGPARTAAIVLANIALPAFVWVLAVRRSRARALWVRSAREGNHRDLRVLPDHPAAGAGLPRLAVPADPSAPPGVLCRVSEGGGTYRDADVAPAARFVADVAWSPRRVGIVLASGAMLSVVMAFVGRILDALLPAS